MTTLLHSLCPQADDWRRRVLALFQAQDLVGLRKHLESTQEQAASWGHMGSTAKEMKVFKEVPDFIRLRGLNKEGKEYLEHGFEWMERGFAHASQGTPEERNPELVYYGMLMGLSPLYPIRLTFHPLYHVLQEGLHTHIDLTQLAFEQLSFDPSWEAHHRALYDALPNAHPIPQTRAGLVMCDVVADALWNEGAPWLAQGLDRWAYTYSHMDLLNAEVERVAGVKPFPDMPNFLAWRSKKGLLELVGDRGVERVRMM